MGTALILTVALGVIVCLLAKREGGAPTALHYVSDKLGMLVSVAFVAPFCIVFSKPWACLIQETVSPISENNNFTYCNPTARIPLLVFSAIFHISLFVFSGLYRCLIFDANLRSANLNSTRWGATTCFAQSLAYLSSFLVTILIEFHPTVSAVIHTAVFAILMCFEVIVLPQTTPHSNSLFSAIYGAAFGSGIVSLLMPVWNSLAANSASDGNKPLTVLSVIFFYVSLVVICAVFATGAGVLAFIRHRKLALIKPVYSLSGKHSKTLPHEANATYDSSSQRDQLTPFKHNKKIVKNKKKKSGFKKKPIGLQIVIDGAVVTHLFSSDTLPLSHSQLHLQSLTSCQSPSTSSLSQVASSPSQSMLFSASSQIYTPQRFSPSSSPLSMSSSSLSLPSSTISPAPSVLSSLCPLPARNIVPSSSNPSFDSVSPFIANQVGIIKAILRSVRSPSAIWTKISFLSDPTFRNRQDVVEFVDNLFIAALKKEKFSARSDLIVSYSLFLSSFMSILRRPNALATQLQRACEQFPSWVDRWLIYVKSKEMEALIRRRETFAGAEGTFGKGRGYSELGSSTSSVSNTFNIHIQLQQATKNDEFSKAHMFRVWSLLSRRSVDVPKVMNHIVKALKYARDSENIYVRLLEQSPDNPNVMRRLALVLRDVYSDDETANKLLHEADELEETNDMEELLSVGNNEDNEPLPTAEGEGWGSTWGNVAGGCANGKGNDSDGEGGRNEEQGKNSAHGISVSFGSGALKSKSRSSLNGRLSNSPSLAETLTDRVHQNGHDRNLRKAKNGELKRKERGNTRRSKKNRFDMLTKDEKEKSKTLLNALLPIVLTGIGLMAVTLLVSYIQIDSQFKESTNCMDTSRKSIRLSIFQSHVLYMMAQSLSSLTNTMIAPAGKNMGSSGMANQAFDQDSFGEQQKEDKATVVSQSQMLKELFADTADSSVWKKDLASFVICYMDYTQVNLIREFLIEGLNLLALINWSQDIALDLADNSIKFPDYHSLLSFFYKGAACYMLNTPLSISSELEVLAMDEYFRVNDISKHNLIMLIILLVFCVAVLMCATILPMIVFIRIVIRERKKAMRLLCTISAEYASKMVERLESSSHGHSHSHRGTISQTATEASLTDRIVDDATKNSTSSLPVAHPIDESCNTPQAIRLALPTVTQQAEIASSPNEACLDVLNDYLAKHQPNSFASQQLFSDQMQPQMLPNSDNQKMRKKAKQLTPKQFKYDLGVPGKGKAKEDREYEEEEKDEKERIAQQRIEDMDEKLHVLGGVVPTSVKWQLGLGAVLLICLACSFYAVSIVAITGTIDHSGKIIFSGYRRVALKQLSALASMVAGKIMFPVADESVFFKDPISSSPAFRNSTFMTSLENVKSTLSVQMQYIQLISKRFLVGSSEDTVTSDERLDSIVITRTQGTDALIDEIMVEPTKCLLINRTLCDTTTPGERMPGVTSEFNGLSELIERTATAVSELVKIPDDELNLNDIHYLFIRGMSLYDAEDSLIRIGDELQSKANEFTTRYSTVLLVVFVVVAVMATAVVVVFILPIPVYIQTIMEQTEAIAEVAGRREVESVKWSEDLVTSVTRIDDAHYVLVEGMRQLVALVNNNEPHEKVQMLLDQLLVATFIHFSDEEKMMLSYKYPTKLRNEHLMAHIQLLRKLVTFLDRMNTHHVPLTEVVLFSSTWIVNHIQSLDAELSLFLLQKGDQNDLNGAIDLSHFEMPGSIEVWLDSDQAPMKEKVLFETAIDNAKKRCRFLI
ncbi:uncharacterized protein MONOS_10743 [Monocercomonoides exilis]|uniref:uncharacterized protein n=1 Tax=Monocercomonoides exilis TaxID=2049356 RepID=UPI0035597C0A|nr:hypothetical protein MONOS_10743 [Monocercomonoides exilis]|eukprot:MONOS_10743.1-p1 / transcript=MONOS_10743.1 / gene=MONOS_10743 / organism=Monocercomonoides_exilis_PA203 / gene_product=unspecified product / transcript_product=unspecified product / location=Mono_scaffold00500:27595-32847(-) / protein_length=1751 / sequence_SO=supercontig / SO=protein_coding / is_pseudo=false